MFSTTLGLEGLRVLVFVIELILLILEIVDLCLVIELIFQFYGDFAKKVENAGLYGDNVNSHQKCGIFKRDDIRITEIETNKD